MPDRIKELEAQLAAANKRLAEDAKRAAIGMALARAQVKNPNTVYDAIAAQVIQHDGRWVTAENGVAKYGPDDGATYSLDRLVSDVVGAATAKPVGSHPGQGGADEPNPFAAESRNLTAQMVMWRTDPDRAAHLEYLAAVRGK